ncbi:MAG TPA: hypothetical protein VKP64_15040 [Mycobacteriales bacterium]|nr:hypothetical protein [Mycobacteriales bacterium]
MAHRSRLWHVTLTVGGPPQHPDAVLAALDRLGQEQPFLLSGRYSSERAELRYWEEAADCGDAAALALRLWGEHRDSAQLPPWTVLAIEVVERGLFRDRGGKAGAPLALVPSGGWRPY